MLYSTYYNFENSDILFCGYKPLSTILKLTENQVYYI